jgi:TolB-like protein
MKNKKIITALILFLSIVISLGAQTLPRLVVIPFAGSSQSDGETVATLFAGQQILRDSFRVIPRNVVTQGAIAMEMNLQRSGLTDTDSIFKYGQQLNAEFVVAGHILTLGNRKLVLVTIFDVKSLQQIAGDYRSYSGDEAEIRGLLPAMAKKLSDATKKNTKNLPGLSVVPFTIRNAVDASNAQILAQLLATDIANSGKYAVFPRTESLEQVQKEYENERSGLTDAATRARMGQGENPNYVLSGTVDRLGSANLFTATILKMDGSLFENGDEEYQNIADGLEKMASLSYKLTGVKPDAMAGRERTEAARVRSEFFQNFIPTDLSFGLHATFGLSSFKNAEYMNVEFMGDFSFGTTIYLSLGFFDNIIALQPEAILLFDNNAWYEWPDSHANYSGFDSSSLLVPVLLRINLYSDWLLISGLGGVYFSIPLGDMTYNKDSPYEKDYKYTVPLGWMAGINLGYNFKSNFSIYADFRYGADIGNTSISDGNGWVEIYQRSIMLFGIGIEYCIEF